MSTHTVGTIGLETLSKILTDQISGTGRYSILSWESLVPYSFAALDEAELTLIDTNWQ